ncbi:MAG TPA: ROK family protein [Thermoanaerobaculia bacterium]|nr:ROK family protein [Thermoanaerobaculia bacterium]
MPEKPRTLCIDIGGTGLKTLVVGADGKPLGERLRVDTPRPATAKALVEAIRGLAQKQTPFDRVSVGFPGVVRKGVVETAFNLDKSWIGVNVDRLLTKELGKPVRAANDADVQGLGAVKGEGVELVITLGTGFGSSLFVDGRLVPNVQLAHHAGWSDKTYEDELGNRALKKAGKKRWNKRLRKAIESLGALFNYDRLYIGGGNARKIRFDLPARVKVVSNVEGLLGGLALWNGKENCYGVR